MQDTGAPPFILQYTPPPSHDLAFRSLLGFFCALLSLIDFDYACFGGLCMVFALFLGFEDPCLPGLFIEPREIAPA